MKDRIYLYALLFLTASFLAACQPGTNNELTDVEEQEYIEKGKKVAATSFKAMSGELKAALQRGGVEEAIKYCNVEAIPITDSLSHAFIAEIRRTSLKPRNPDNAPDSLESLILVDYIEQFQRGGTLKPMLRLVEVDTVLFTAPIMILPLCLNCHGTPGENILDTNYRIIHNLYPSDQAIGYKEGDFRGMWSIRFVRGGE